MLLILFLATLLGVLVHHGVFIRGEWHLRGPAVVITHAAVAALTWSGIAWKQPVKKYRSLDTVIALFCCYMVGLFGSIMVYRLFFHRLRHFPGPRLAATSKLWHIYQCRDSRNHLVLDSLHKQYGDFVRTGELANRPLRSADAIN